MKSHNIKSCAKYGLFLLLVICLAGTANAATGHTGGIALSWDDVQNVGPCYENRDIFKNYSANCTINIYRLYDWGQGTTDNLTALQNDGWEIAAHGYNHNDSVEDLKNYTSAEWLDKEIFPNIVELKGYGYPAYSFAYPYGSRNETTDALLAPYFKTIRTTAFGTDNINQTGAYYKWDDTQVLYGVEIDEQSGVSMESIKFGIDEAIKNGYVLVLYGHKITPTVDGKYQTSTSRLEEILNYTKEHNGTFYLMKDLGNSSWEQWSPRFSNVTANFTVSSDTVMTGESVKFVDYSVNHTSELLDFGDGSTSTTADVTHVYTTPGPYTVTLTVKNDISSHSTNHTITVFKPEPPVASFTNDRTKGPIPLKVAFTDKSTGLRTSWLWDFGDGLTSKDPNPVHEYSNIGTYNVMLTVANGNGSNSTQKVNYITVFEPVSANFYCDTTSGPLTVRFSDTSTGSPTSWKWNFGDEAISTEQNPTHIYSAAGTYTVKLTASNANDTDERTTTITVSSPEEEHHSSGGSSHSSGGGGGSPEPARNVEVKELSQAFITNGKYTQFDFTKNATCVVYVGFDAKKTVGKTTTIAEQLKNKSTLVSGLPEGVVYKYFNVWAGNSGFATSKNIENPVICFKVAESWVQNNKIDKDSITLNRYSDKKWEKLEAKLLREDNKYLYFESSVPGYSFFAITGKTTANKAGDVITPEPETQENKQNDTGSEVNQTSVRRTRAPGFETIYCIIGLFGVFLYRRR